MKKTIKVSKIEKKDGESMGKSWTRYDIYESFQGKDIKYSTFDTNFGAGFVVGQTYDIQFDEVPQSFTNQKGQLVKYMQRNLIPSAEVLPMAEILNQPFDKNQEIRNCLKTISELRQMEADNLKKILDLVK